MDMKFVVVYIMKNLISSLQEDLGISNSNSQKGLVVGLDS